MTGASSRAGLPPFAPRRKPIIRSSIKPSEIPESITGLLSNVYTIIQNRPRLFTRSRTRRPKRWWTLSSHRQPTRWSLYRNLLRYSQRFDDQLIQPTLNPLKPTIPNRSNLSSNSPVLTNWIKSEFRRHRSRRTIPYTQELLRQAYQLLNKLANAHAGGIDDLSELKSYRQELAEKVHRDSWAKVYRSVLNDRKPPTPIMTGRFLRPTIYNGPLPRLAHQPLHISMMIYSRRKARERRLTEQRQLKEKLDLIQQESRFEKSMGYKDWELFEKEKKDEVQGIMDRLKVIENSFTRERERERQVYSRELLDKIEAARRRRPKVMEERNRWKRTKLRMAEVSLATEDDPNRRTETAEGKQFRIPGSSFWEN